jgi:hypothetical protein
MIGRNRRGSEWRRPGANVVQRTMSGGRSKLLVGYPYGATEEALILGHGFKPQMLASLVRAKLAKRYHLNVTGRGRTTGVTVTYLKITEAGRKAIED